MEASSSKQSPPPSQRPVRNCQPSEPPIVWERPGDDGRNCVTLRFCRDIVVQGNLSLSLSFYLFIYFFPYKNAQRMARPGQASFRTRGLECLLLWWIALGPMRAAKITMVYQDWDWIFFLLHHHHLLLLPPLLYADVQRWTITYIQDSRLLRRFLHHHHHHHHI